MGAAPFVRGVFSTQGRAAVYPGSPRSLLDRLLGFAFGVLVIAVMLHVAARLLEEVWRTLATAGAVALLTVAVVGLVRVVMNRWRYW